jgi:hypothetical protein
MSPERAFGSLTKAGRFDRVVDVHHNYAAWENHLGRMASSTEGRRAGPGR